MSRSPAPCPRFRSLAILLGGYLLAFIVVQSPHLVHHLFELGHPQTECAIASSANHAPGALPDLSPLIPALQSVLTLRVTWRAHLPSAPRTPSEARAPPPLPS